MNGLVTRTVFLGALLLMSAISSAQSTQFWDQKLSSAELKAVAKLMVDPANPRWPAISWAPRDTAARRPEYALAIKLFDKIEAAEWADAGFDPAKQAEIISTYIAIANQLRASGGYANLLLADTLNRLAVVRLSRWAMNDPRNADQAAKFLSELKLPVVNRPLLTALVAEDVLEGGKPKALRFPAADPKERAVLGGMVADVASARGALDEDRHPWAGPRGGEQDFNRLYRTRFLLQNPNLHTLISRLESTDYQATSLPAMLLLSLKEKPEVFSPTRPARRPPRPNTIEGRFSQTFGVEPFQMSLKDFFGERMPSAGGYDLDVFKRNLAAPGLGGNGGVPETLYAWAVDFQPNKPFRPALNLEVRRTPLNVAGVGTVVASPSGQTVAMTCQAWVAAAPTTAAAAATTATTNGAIASAAATSPRARPAPPTDGKPGIQVVVNGKAGKPYLSLEPIHQRDGTLPFLIFSREGEHVLYVGHTAAGSVVVVDGQEGKAYRYIDTQSLRLSENGRTVVYVASEGKKSFVVVNGKEYGPYEVAYEMAVSADGSRSGWVARKPMDGKPFEPVGGPSNPLRMQPPVAPTMLIIDGTEGPEIKDRSGLVFSADGKRWAYATATDAGPIIRIAGQNPADLAVPGLPIAFSPDGKRLISESPSGNSLVVDGRVVAHFSGRFGRPPSFSPNGGAIRCVTAERSAQIAPDGKVLGETASLAVFNEKGSRFVPWHRSDRPDQFVGNAPSTLDLNDGRSTRTYGEIPFTRFGPDERLYFGAIDGAFGEMRIFFSVEGVDLPQLTAISSRTLGFSSDGTFYVVATKRGCVWRITVNGQDSEEVFDDFAPVPAYFTSPNSFRMIAKEDGRLVQVDVTITGRPPAATAPSIKPIPAFVDSPAGTAASQKSAWNRQVVVADTHVGVFPSPVTGLVVDGQPMLVHLRRNGTDSGYELVTSTRSADGKWTTQRAMDDGEQNDCMDCNAALVGDTVYAVTTHMTKLVIRSMKKGVWKTEYVRDKRGIGAVIRAIGGQPLVLFGLEPPPSMAFTSRAATLTRTADGKWTEAELALPHNHGLTHFDAREIGGSGYVLLTNYNGTGTIFGRLPGGAQDFEVISPAAGYANLLQIDAKPAVFTTLLYTKEGEKWKSTELIGGNPGMADYNASIVGTDTATIGGRPALLYCDRRSHEMHYRAWDGARWSDATVDLTIPSGERGVSLFEVNGRAAVAFLAQTGTKASLVYVEAAPIAK